MSMNISRVLRIVLLFIPMLLAGACSNPDRGYIAYVGTYTGHGSDGIYAYRFDPIEGTLSALGLVAKTENPSFITIDPGGRFLYAVNEIDSFANKSSGAVSVFAINSASGKLDLLQQIPSLGANPAHLSLDKSAGYLMVANYTGGNVAVFPRNNDGTLGSETAFVQDVGSGPNIERQEGPHAHFIGVTPDNQFALVADLGVDKVLLYRFDQHTGSLKASDPPSVSLNPGDGPRHIAFAPSGNFMYVVNELTSTVTLFSFGAANGNSQPLETVTTLPKTFSGLNTTAEILTDTKGKYLYVSNRGDNSIVVYSIEDDARLTPLEWIPTGGMGPRYIGIDPTGRWLFAANQNSNNIKLFRIDQASGRLTATDRSVELNAPVCIKFLPLELNSR